MNGLKISLAGLVLTAAIVSLTAQSAVQTSGQQPNILFIVSEDNGPDLGCYGAPVKTPNLDRLAGEGTRFEHAYVTQAGCSPSRASFLTGTYPHQNGQIGLATWKYSMYREQTPNLVNDLKKSGYRTGIIGKIHVNPEDAFAFDWREGRGGNFQRENLDRYAEAAFEFMSASDEPFFLQVNYPDAHTPFLPQVDGRPAEILTAASVEPLPHIGFSNQDLKQRTADYYNCMMRLDDCIGELLAKLKESGKYGNTLIVYIGDHGADLIRGKRTCYEGGIRIPMIITWPEHGKQGLVYDGLVSTIDLYPTFMQASGNPVPGHLRGISLLSVLNGNSAAIREYLFTEFHVHSHHNPYPQRAVRNERYKLIHNLVTGNVNPGYAFTRWKKIDPVEMDESLKHVPRNVAEAYERMEDPPVYELYDLQEDPYEWNNLAGNRNYSKILDELTGALCSWQEQTHDPMTDTKLALRLFYEVMETNQEKVEILYHKYLDPCSKPGEKH
jgi:N-sulfoglucosamine sulfohydrolase